MGGTSHSAGPIICCLTSVFVSGSALDSRDGPGLSSVRLGRARLAAATVWSLAAKRKSWNWPNTPHAGMGSSYIPDAHCVLSTMQELAALADLPPIAYWTCRSLSVPNHDLGLAAASDVGAMGSPLKMAIAHKPSARCLPGKCVSISGHSAVCRRPH